MNVQGVRLYVHIPFCLHKCHYCDFNSHVFADPPWETYTNALIKELEFYAQQPQFLGRKITSVFFGGGTPSLAPAQLFEQVLTKASALFTFEDNIEISLEANPGASEASRFQAYRAAGINRVSIGVQSFDHAELKWLERIHSADEAELAFGMAREAGFENINLDLMYALPHQSLPQWFVSLDKAIALKPEHLSCYQLTVEPHTQLFISHQKSPLAMPDEELAMEFFWQTRARLKQAGFAAYEISNFSQAGKHCQHNCGYWLYDDYIGIGAGASGKWDKKHSDENNDGTDVRYGVHRYSNMRSPQTYMKAVSESGCAVQSAEDLNVDQAFGEALWLGLRMQQGVDLKWLEQRFGQSIQQAYPRLLQQWLRQDKICLLGDKMFLTDSGLILADDIAASFLK